MRVAISEEDGAQSLTMRIIEIDPEGYTPMHAHTHEHALFVLRGRGVLTDGKKECKLDRDDVIFIQSNQTHQIKNTGDSELVLVSTIPICDK